MFRLIRSLFRSALKGVSRDPQLLSVQKNHPEVTNFVKKRLNPRTRFGFHLTLGVVIAFIFTTLFFSILEELINQGSLIQSDLRVINILSSLRSPILNKVMLFITYLGNWQFIFLGTFFAGLILLLAKKRAYFLALFISVIGGEIIFQVAKHIIQRPRPSLVNALIQESSFSFPSGHAFLAISFYGILAYFFIKQFKSKTSKILILLASLLLVILIGFSRIYLGVHWPSDILASYTAGIVLLASIITALEIKLKVPSLHIHTPHITRKSLYGLSIILLGIWIIFIVHFFNLHPTLQPLSDTRLPPIAILSSEIPQGFFINFPKTSENLVGNPVNPINLIFIGSKGQLTNAFEAAGWTLNDEITLKSTYNLIKAELFNKPYPEAPGVPSLWNARPNEFAFEKPTSSNSVSERHHIHIWETPFLVNNSTEVWFTTAHFDKDLIFQFSFAFAVHEIDPNVDKERENIRDDLLKTGLVEDVTEFQLVEPTLGKNGGGHHFFTDGKAVILYLK